MLLLENLKLHICSHDLSICLTLDSWSSALPQSPKHFPDSETHKSLEVPVCKCARMHVYIHTHTIPLVQDHSYSACPVHSPLTAQSHSGKRAPKGTRSPDLPTEHRPEDLTPSLGVEGRCLPSPVGECCSVWLSDSHVAGGAFGGSVSLRGSCEGGVSALVLEYGCA